MTTITIGRASELLNYEPTTGIFTWRSAAGIGGHIPAGSPAGSCNSDGRRYIRLDRKTYCASQLAWLMSRGEWPAENVIFLNGAHDDTRSTNLELMSRLEKPDLSIIELTLAELQRQLDFDPMTGVFIWKRTGRRGVRFGRRAGNLDPQNGHRKIRLNEREYLAQRLAWFWVNGEWPDRPLRFLDGNQDNVAVENLALPEYDTRTPEGRRDYERTTRARRFDVIRAGYMRTNFGMPMDVYQHLFVAQKGLCAICLREERSMRGGKVKWLAVDHDHKTNVVRGLLCEACNTTLGKMDDDPARLRAAADYLEKNHDVTVGDNVVRFMKKGPT